MGISKFWMVLADNSAQTTVRHPSLGLAKVEAERLARVAPGVKFFVLAVEGFAVKRDVDWHLPMHDDFGEEIPF